MINILIRLHEGRKQLFDKCMQSIINQTYKDVRVIVSIEDEICLPYLEGYEVEVCRVTPDRTQGEAFYNLYCNDLKNMMNEGFGFFLDSDDYLSDNTVLARISDYLTDDCDAVICQIQRDFRLPKPSAELLDKKQIISGKISMQCLIFHHSVKNYADINADDNGDFQWIKKMSEKVKIKFIQQVVVHSPKRNFGK